jgi:transcriptional regulator with XRE-family HTH domain
MKRILFVFPKAVKREMLSTHAVQTEPSWDDNAGMPKVPISQILTKNLEDLMAARGMNQQRLADRAGLAVSSLSEIRRGIVSPGIDTLDDIARALGVDAWELIIDSAETRRRAIERALRHDPPANEPLAFIPQIAEEPRRKEVAHRQRKKPAPKGARGADAS